MSDIEPAAILFDGANTSRRSQAISLKRIADALEAANEARARKVVLDGSYMVHSTMPPGPVDVSAYRAEFEAEAPAAGLVGYVDERLDVQRYAGRDHVMWGVWDKEGQRITTEAFQTEAAAYGYALQHLVTEELASK